MAGANAHLMLIYNFHQIGENWLRIGWELSESWNYFLLGFLWNSVIVYGITIQFLHHVRLRQCIHQGQHQPGVVLLRVSRAMMSRARWCWVVSRLGSFLASGAPSGPATWTTNHGDLWGISGMTGSHWSRTNIVHKSQILSPHSSSRMSLYLIWHNPPYSPWLSPSLWRKLWCCSTWVQWFLPKSQELLTPLLLPPWLPINPLHRISRG